MTRGYRDEYRAAERDVYWTLPRVIIGLVLISFALGAAGMAISLFTAPMRSVTGVVNKTLDPDNIINNYEWFHDAYGNFLAKQKQVIQYKEFLKAETDPTEKQRLRVDMAAVQQSCRDLGERYNANADKSNRSIFMGRDVPSQLNVDACE